MLVWHGDTSRANYRVMWIIVTSGPSCMRLVLTKVHRIRGVLRSMCEQRITGWVLRVIGRVWNLSIRRLLWSLRIVSCRELWISQERDVPRIRCGRHILSVWLMVESGLRVPPSMRVLPEWNLSFGGRMPLNLR
jgi:hypothetical protein